MDKKKTVATANTPAKQLGSQKRKANEEPEQELPARRLRSTRNRPSPVNDYHPTYKKENLADIPEAKDVCPAEADEDSDHEEAVVTASQYQLTDEDADTLKDEITHLSFETTLKLFAFHNYNLRNTIDAARQMVAPQMLPDNVKDMFVANVPYERERHPTKKKAYKMFYMKKAFRKVASNKALVDFYYNEKNKKEGNWRLEQEEEHLEVKNVEEENLMEENSEVESLKEDTEQIEVEYNKYIEARMLDCGISIVTGHPIAKPNGRRGNRKSSDSQRPGTSKDMELFQYLTNPDFDSEDDAGTFENLAPGEYCIPSH